MQIQQKFKVPILTYHSIDSSGSVISTSPDVFRRQIYFLGENGYNVVPLNAFISSLFENYPLPRKTIVMTFDDGFQNFYTTAFPILERYGFKATVFLVTDYCGKRNQWEINSPGIPLSSMLSWTEIRQLTECGIEFGAHTRSHPDLTGISLAEAEREIVESKDAIENALGCRVTTFAYPYGRFNRAVKKIAENNFQAAVSTVLGKARLNSDVFSLERIDAYYLSNPKIFSLMPSKTFDGYMRVRQAMRDVKNLISRN